MLDNTFWQHFTTVFTESSFDKGHIKWCERVGLTWIGNIVVISNTWLGNVRNGRPSQNKWVSPPLMQ